LQTSFHNMPKGGAAIPPPEFLDIEHLPRVKPGTSVVKDTAPSTDNNPLSLQRQRLQALQRKLVGGLILISIQQNSNTHATLQHSVQEENKKEVISEETKKKSKGLDEEEQTSLKKRKRNSKVRHEFEFRSVICAFDTNSTLHRNLILSH
jgi:hypothetical protein